MTTILAIPNYRLTATDKTAFGFWEVPAGQPAALRAWFYPGDNFGQEFAYPKQKAAEIAAFVKAPVPAIVVETVAEEDLRTAPLVVVQETGVTQPVAVAAVAEVAPTPVPEAAPVTPEPVATLPHTASNMPLVGLAGLASLAMFFALGFSSRRRRSVKA
jgi:LPXTG-motif cell wall-anchored protein